jgi:hypothetical protein
MARRSREGVETLYVEVPPALKQWLGAQADAHRRSLTGELIVLLETHLDPRYKPEPPPPAAKAKK